MSKPRNYPGAPKLRILAAAALLALLSVPTSLTASAGSYGSYKPGAFGELDCNGQSRIQQSVKRTMLCTDVRGFAGVDNANTWGGRFYDNGLYIGHDEPDMTFYSSKKGSGNDVTWTETLGRDPTAAPTATNPGHDVAHWFELTPAPWFSMAVCDSNSYPQLSCTPNSDVNAPACANAFNCPQNAYPGGGDAFLELQFYPPGFSTGISCDDTHWCAALNIDSLECTNLYAQCNPNCGEPVNFAFIQTDGVPAGPPSPQLSNLDTFTPDAGTLLMNPGDKIRVHVFDAPAPAPPGQKASALETVVDDLTTGQGGFMQASAANGFANTSIVDCTGAAFNFEPEYSTAARGNIGTWTALQTNISTEYEIGHFTPCTSVSQPATYVIDPNVAPGQTETYYQSCSGPYEDDAPGGDGGTAPETSDAPCYPQGYTGGFLNLPPDTVTGCMDAFFQNGDLDFDGTSYWAEWPTGSDPTATLPGSFMESPPTTAGHRYSQFGFQTDAALSEYTCSSSTLKGCAVPPLGPGHFYPYWSEVNRSGGCAIEFGNVASGANLKNFGRDRQYGYNRNKAIGYPEIESKLYANTCTRSLV